MLTDDQIRNGPSGRAAKGCSGCPLEEDWGRICPDDSNTEKRFGSSNWNRVGEVLEAMLGSETQPIATGVDDEIEKVCELLEYESTKIDSTGGRQGT